ncbi:hypothetical protein PP568_06935 [Mycobacteroides abscessus]|uniref:Uncharacterized protein n=2 Tax=Mycobacteroides abscessus TaxID=36809 RepID=A0AB38D2M5_9MYCO|nr:hypothetical protein [Mycobacteroides abscessus]MBE5419588.1 hypothetical protein [Mycobacteroides abscessus]MBE5455712.1 hypothetical protein [Mycobacteroides abscessus]MBN7555273.1 hypothetical protein [Mycobacteroides abscessus subsp. abscessus]MDM2404666.1 hypothetical protein [Mycobacteroides abscessus]MDM2414384.1 hypothetical protein [Mycobacteroides abscessus]
MRIGKYPVLLQLILLAVVAIAGFATGSCLYPKSDVEPVLARGFMLEVPSAIQDANGGSAFLSAITWDEVHGSEGRIPVLPWMAERPLSANGVRVGFSVGYAGPITTDVPITIAADVPASAVIAACTGSDGANVHCDPAQKWHNQMFDEDQVRVTIRGTIKARPTDDPFHSSLSAQVDFSGVNGVAVAATRTRLAVQLPMVIFPVPPGAGNQPLPTPSHNLFVNAFLSDPGGIRWTQQPSATGGNVPSMVGWRKAYPPDPADANLGAVPLTGVRESVLREDSTHIFWSGIALGIGGAAAVAWLQALLAAFVSRSAERARAAAAGASQH